MEEKSENPNGGKILEMVEKPWKWREIQLFGSKQASKQTCKQASKRASKQANVQASKQACKQTSKQASEQANEDPSIPKVVFFSYQKKGLIQRRREDIFHDAEKDDDREATTINVTKPTKLSHPG